MSSFKISFTTPHYGAGNKAESIAEVLNFWNAKVIIPWQSWRTCEFEMSLYDTAVEDISEKWGWPAPLETLIHVEYRGKPVFWGVVEGLNAGTEDGRIRVSCKDNPGHYFQHNFVRRGDLALSPPWFTKIENDVDKASIPLDYRALRLLMDTSQASQDYYPVLGVRVGYNDDPQETRTYGIERGQQIDTLWTNIAQNTLGPDFEFLPLSIVDGRTDRTYTELRTYAKLERDRTKLLVWESGFGQDNCQIDWEPGGRVVTHCHVLYNKNKNRVTRANPTAASLYGTHVAWERLDADNLTAEVASAWADSILEAYGHPNNFFTVKPRRGDELKSESDEFHYGEDYTVGDLCVVAAKRGYLRTPRITGQIREVRLVQKDASGQVSEELESVPNVGTFVDSDA